MAYKISARFWSGLCFARVWRAGRPCRDQPRDQSWGKPFHVDQHFLAPSRDGDVLFLASHGNENLASALFGRHALRQIRIHLCVLRAIALERGETDTGADESWADQGHSNPVPCFLRPHSLEESVQAEFRGRVAGAQWHSTPAGDA